MELLTLEECLERELFSKKIFNRLRRIEQILRDKGICDTLPQFLHNQYYANEITISQLTRDLQNLTGMSTGHGRLREYMVVFGIPILTRADASRGKRNPNYGNTGDKNPLTGTKQSEEFRAHLSEIRKGQNNPFYRRIHTQEVRDKISQLTKGKTWEEICGEDRAKKRKEILIAKQSGKNSFFYGKKGSASPTFGKTFPPSLSSSHGGYRRDIGHFVRSTWEANLARVFIFRGELYEYEPERFPLEITEEYQDLFPGRDKTTYLPDFKNRHFYEVKGTFKGSWGDKSLAKLLMFMEQYSFEVEIIDKVKYELLEEEFAPQINADSRFCGWETLKDNIKTNPSKYK